MTNIQICSKSALLTSNMSKLIQRYGTPGFSGYSCAYSPFYPDKLAVATSANFGLVGNGRLHILQADPTTSLNGEKAFDSQDGLYDVAWSEIHENQVATGSGDGSIKLWDIMLNVNFGLFFLFEYFFFKEFHNYRFYPGIQLFINPRSG
ncbi:hypothetical protein Pst134EB_006291 [Puccinia striiformis f. sp. tritici]|nr:hypothetical protein Pst134EB_006291 [Puccinia striiformis f. sp. tritici]